MSYSNTIVTVVQSSTAPLPASYSTINLLSDIPHTAQLEVERVFSSPEATQYLASSGISAALKNALFIIPVSRCTFNTATNQLTAVDLSSFTITNNNIAVVIPALVDGQTITIRRKTISNLPLVSWTAGSKLTTAQLNKSTNQVLFLTQEILFRIQNNLVGLTTIIAAESLADLSITAAKLAVDSVITTKILNANVTTAKIADASVTTAKIVDASVTTAKIVDANVTNAKLANSSVLLGGQTITLGSAATTTLTGLASVTSTAFTGNGIIPIGGIIMFSGTAEVPSGWALCDGQNGTPDLVNKFIRGGSSSGVTGGLDTATLSTANLPSHSHFVSSITVETADSVTTLTALNTLVKQTTHSTLADQRYNLSGSATAATVGLTSLTGSGSSFSILPSYYTLRYIMRTA